MVYNPRLLIIHTGGTIDAEPYANPQNPPPIVDTLPVRKSKVGAAAREATTKPFDELTWGLKHERRLVKDSNLFRYSDIIALAKTIKADPHRTIIITHGTDAMAKNARHLQKELAGTDKRVVFVGAMVPLSMQHQAPSDGVEALDFALKQAPKQKPGIYLVARDSAKSLGFFDPSYVEKDRDASRWNLAFTIRPNWRGR